jgi:hypothetical protein
MSIRAGEHPASQALLDAAPEPTFHPYFGERSA